MIYTYVLKHQSLVYAVGFILVLIRFFFFFCLLFIHRKRNRGEKGIESMTSLHSWMINFLANRFWDIYFKETIFTS